MALKAGCRARRPVSKDGLSGLRDRYHSDMLWRNECALMIGASVKPPLTALTAKLPFVQASIGGQYPALMQGSRLWKVAGWNARQLLVFLGRWA